MSTISCSEFIGQLESWMEDGFSEVARAHARDCSRCRSLMGDLQAIRETAQTWAASEETPPARVWTSLRAQLEQEGLIRPTEVGADQPAARRSAWFGWLSALPRPALAGAYLAALLAFALGVAGPGGRHVNDSLWMARMMESTQPLGAQLDVAEQGAVSSLASANPAVIVSLHQNLAIVDNYIALCEKSVREEPQNEVARDYLFGAYQQKADLLAQMTDRGDNGQ